MSDQLLIPIDMLAGDMAIKSVDALWSLGGAWTYPRFRCDCELRVGSIITRDGWAHRAATVLHGGTQPHQANSPMSFTEFDGFLERLETLPAPWPEISFALGGPLRSNPLALTLRGFDYFLQTLANPSLEKMFIRLDFESIPELLLRKHLALAEAAQIDAAATGGVVDPGAIASRLRI